MELLRDISRIGVSGLGVEDLGLTFLQTLQKHIPFDRGVVRTVDQSSGELSGGVAYGIGSDLPLPTARTLTATQAIGLGRVVTDDSGDPEDSDPDGEIANLGLTSSVTVPLLTDEAAVGLLTLRRKSEGGFDTDEVDLLSIVANQLGPSLDNSLLLETVSNLAAIVETSPDIILRASTEGQIEYINPSGLDALGLPDSYANDDGLNIKQILDATSFESLIQRGIPTAVGGTTWSAELNVTGSEDRVISVESLVVANYHRNGSLRGVSISMRDITDRKVAEDELQRLATTDTLTGLPNRYQLGILLDQANRSAKRTGAQHALVFLDLDGFKLVNDTHGHSIGDELIVAVGHKLDESLRSSDLVARVGGDEFNVILYDANEADAVVKAVELLADIAEVTLTVRGERVQVSASAGVASFPVEDASMEDLTSFADIALYQAKDAGRNQAMLYDPSQGGRDVITALQQKRTSILDALDNHRLTLFLQPIYGVESREIEMYEVLVRIKEADGTLINPAEFIAEAESLDLIQQIDERVIASALHRSKKWADCGQRTVLTINVSSRSVGMEMAEYAISIGTELGVNPFDIVFEITETATQRSGGHATTFVNRLTDAGYRVAIDDFGSGTTSLRQIRTLPFQLLKLDESLVLTLAKNAHDREFAKAICGLAHAIGLDVIAEFVQDEETLKFLGEIGVKYAQGYYLGKPEPFPLDPG